MIEHPDDVSSLGAEDWENHTLEQSTAETVQSSQKGGFDAAYGEMDQVDIEMDKKQYYEENALVIDGFKCPDEYIHIITPMEFEEMVNLFVKFDANGSGTIDKHEAKKILHFLGMDFSLEKAEDLLKIIDVDGNGEVDFEEFCHFIVMIKRGDERLKGFGNMIEKLHCTPLGELERQAAYRNLKIAFHVVEVRAATLTMPTTFVVECQLTGTWYGVENGEIISKYATRRFQGMGLSSREAKYAAASSAMVSLGQNMPGVKYPPGEFPPDWLEWVDTNLLRGIEPGKVVSILASKGFHPHRNLKLMHRILAWHSLLRFCEEHPEIDVADTSEPYPEELLEWIRWTCQKGVDGIVFYQLLQDRCVDLNKQHLHFSQQLQNNELGCLMEQYTGKNKTATSGQRANLLDFHYACKQGYLDYVEIFCKCNDPVNEEKIDRHSTERITPLQYAAMNGHAAVCKVLLEFGANVNHVNNRGRNAVHFAAANGHRDAIDVLVKNGGNIFAGDFQGNTPLHLAALGNHLKAVDFLADRGQEVARQITSDKVRCKANTTFDELVEECFQKVPEMKLRPNETIRFEKPWIHDAAILFLKLMDKNVKYMIPVSCKEIMQDVLARFDPRPETGIFIMDQISGQPVFIKSVANPQDLSTLLKYVFRQAAVDSINYWHRTALHLACDANKVNSHEQVIYTLINKYGCNVSLIDMHQRRAIDLLMQDKVIRDAPSATQAREEVITTKREQELSKLFTIFAMEEKAKVDRKRAEILQECIDREDMMDERLWNTLRKASIFKRTVLKLYHMYEDPDTGNYFFCKISQKKVMNENMFEEYTWHYGPPYLQYLIDRQQAIMYLRGMQSKLLRTYGPWELSRCNMSQIQFYYNKETEELRFQPPEEMSWRNIIRESKNTGEKLGYANEWDIYTDKYDNIFYRNRITKYCEYERPIDAVVVTPEEMLCTYYQYKTQERMQKWYSCEQCNRAWKTVLAERTMSATAAAAEAAAMGVTAAVTTTQDSSAHTRTLVVCEPCIARCHKGHKGVRYLYQGVSGRGTNCMCIDVSKVTQSFYCQACQISDKQLNTQKLADEYRAEMRAFRQRNLMSPPVFACVPRYSRTNQVKLRSGWQICRMYLPPALQDRLKGNEEKRKKFRRKRIEQQRQQMIRERIAAKAAAEGIALSTYMAETGGKLENDNVDDDEDDQINDDWDDFDLYEDHYIEEDDGSLLVDPPSMYASQFSHSNKVEEEDTATATETFGEEDDGDGTDNEETSVITADTSTLSKPTKKSNKSKKSMSQSMTIAETGQSHVSSVAGKSVTFGDGVDDGNSVIDNQSVAAQSVASSLVRYDEGNPAEIHLHQRQEENFRAYKPNTAAGVAALKTTKNIIAHTVAQKEEGWIIAYDCEETETLKHGDAVLCKRYKQEYPRLMARVKQIVRPGFYKVRFDDRNYGEEILERSYIELITRPKFYFNIFTGQNCWMRRQRSNRDSSIGTAPSTPLIQSSDGGGEISEKAQSQPQTQAPQEDDEPEPHPDDPLYKVYPSQPLMISGPEWTAMYNQSTIRASFDEYDEMYNAALDMVYYMMHGLYQEEKGALKLQILYRHKQRKRPPYLPWQSFAFTFDLPENVKRLKKIKAGWAYLRRRSKSVGEFLDADGSEWEEYMDSKSSEYFYWQEEDNLYSWDKPRLYERNTNAISAFKLNEEVLYRFPGRRNEEISIITRVRFDDQTGEDMYDLQNKYATNLLSKWIPRIQIKPVPLEGDALMLNRMETKWKNVLRRKREADERAKQREKELRLQEEIKRLEYINSMAYKIKGDRESGNDEQLVGRTAAQLTMKIMRGRLERISLEAMIIREEIDEREGKKRRELIEQQVEVVRKQLGGRLSRADILNIQRSIEMKLLLHEKIEKRNALQAELLEQRDEAEERLARVERVLRDQEVAVTTPRSLKRRKLIRQTHIAMKRQAEKFIICEWGCGDWLKIGFEQQDHQLRKCCKRILPCTLGCPLKNTEEDWLATHQSSTVLPKSPKKKVPLPIQGSRTSSRIRNATGRNGGNNSIASKPFPLQTSQSTLEGGLGSRKEGSQVSFAVDPDMPRRPGSGSSLVLSTTSANLAHQEETEKAVIGVITNQQYHETHECPKRLVICPLQCLEWVCAEVLDVHVTELCTKRPAKPLECRLGCGMIFGGKIEALISAEDDRALHELEECDYRIVRCNWIYDDGRMCTAQMKATERPAHRDYHLQSLGIINYPVPGTYVYRVPKGLTRMKVQLWGGGGGSGYFYGRQGGNGGGGAYVEAIIDLEPYTVLELTVGGGGSGGVTGTAIQTMDLQEMRSFTAAQKEAASNILIHDDAGQSSSSIQIKGAFSPDRVLVPPVEVIDAQCGVTMGGTPGGGEGYGGDGCWAAGGGGGYTAISKKSSRGTSLLLLAAGGGGGGSLPGLPGGGLHGTLPGTVVDPINGCTATVEKPGKGGESGSTYNAKWPASPGGPFQGGNGCEFGAGGGGGYFGGGGGGTMPGIAGGGGGGSSYVYPPIARDFVIVSGHGNLPGGMQHHPPTACGVGEWDKVDGVAGQGGRGDPCITMRGNNGAIRLLKPGNY